MINSFRNKFITIIISLSVIPLLLLGGVLIWQNYIVEIGRIKQSQTRKTILAARNISQFLHEQENKILTLLRLDYFPDMSKEEQRKRLSKFIVTAKDDEHDYTFDNIIIVDVNGHEKIKVSRTNLVQSNDHTDWNESELYTKPLTTDKIFYSPISFSQQTGEPILKMSVPIMNLRTQKPAEILIAEMKLKFMWQLVNDLKIGNEGSAFLTDQNGRVVVHPNRSIVLKTTHFEVPSLTTIKQGLNGEKSIIVPYKITIGNLPLYFITEVPTSEALKNIHDSFYILGAVMLLTLGAAIALVLVLVHQIVRPLESLASTAKEISSGNYAKRAELYNTKEFWELSGAFNAMTDRLHETIASLESQIDFVEKIIESLTHPFYVIDINNYVVKMANSAANFGMLTSDSTCYKLTHGIEKPCRAPSHPCTVEEIRKTGKPVMLEHVHCKKKDGVKHTYEIYGYPVFDQNGKITQVIEYNIDITARKNLEDQLRQGQKLEAIGSLASGVAHDFNNLLTTILGYSELSLMKLAEDDPQREQIESIYEAGQKAATLTRQLLAFSRKQVLEMQVVNLNSLLDNLTKMLNRMIGDDVEMVMMLDPSIGNIMADPGQIEQILMNLAINARDAMPNGGTITIETQEVELDEQYCKDHAEVAPGNYIVLCVTDTGNGMTQEVMQKIFDPFFTTKKKGSGTGLGLSTVYGIVKQHKGHIYVYSEIGSGTVFKIYFREIKKDTETAASKQISAMASGTETILVVDDEPSIRKLVRDTLEPLGYTILEAPNGEKALEYYRKNHGVINLLLTDVVMPKMTGKKLAEFLLKDNPDLKVLYMSGYTDNVIAHKGVLDKDVHFLNKPLVPSILTRKIREILEK